MTLLGHRGHILVLPVGHRSSQCSWGTARRCWVLALLMAGIICKTLYFGTWLGAMLIHGTHPCTDVQTGMQLASPQLYGSATGQSEHQKQYKVAALDAPPALRATPFRPRASTLPTSGIQCDYMFAPFLLHTCMYMDTLCLLFSRWFACLLRTQSRCTLRRDTVGGCLVVKNSLIMSGFFAHAGPHTVLQRCSEDKNTETTQHLVLAGLGCIER
jgi:hypothetical protein